MSGTRKLTMPKEPKWIGSLLVAALACLAPVLVQADVRLTSDWDSRKACAGLPRTNAELAEVQMGLRPKGECTKTEGEKVEEASARSAVARSAALDRTRKKNKDYWNARGFKLHLDGHLHYLEPMRFMTKSRPDEVCTPSDFKGQPTYRCDEGQRNTTDCHILIFNDRFEEVGYHRIQVKEPYQLYCNAVPAIGVGDAANNLLLTTVQYFPIDRKHASKISEVGSGWNRMTVLLRLKRQEDGRVLIEQEDNCLGNPNRLESIQDARRKLKKCTATGELHITVDDPKIL